MRIGGLESEIHPTAIIHPSAELGFGCRVGPYCVIHEGVRLGDGCWLQNHVTVAGPSTIGRDNRFYAFCSIGQRTQDLKYDGEPTLLEIGEGNTFREFCTINRGTGREGATQIGSHGNFLAYSHVAHDCVVGDHVIFSNNGTLAGHVIVEDYAVLGGLTAVHQFCRIGRHAITGGCSKIVQDVPPFMIADGNPAAVRGLNQVGLERHGFTAEDLRQLKEAYKILFMRSLPQADALQALLSIETAGEPVRQLADFIAQSERGIVRRT
ncbi:MAG: acyl-ACP--UDP-N-acetylglucosamine O-acyltransferase [Verrucomicrobiales bacterium]